MFRVGIYGAARGLGSTLLAAHLYYYLREHGVDCSASSRGFRGGRPLGLTRWTGVSATKNAQWCKETLPTAPFGFGVQVYDLHAELIAAELGENACDTWLVPIRDEESLEDGLQIAARLGGRVFLVWNGADDALRRRVSLPCGRVRVAGSALPKSDLLRRADEARTPIWCLPGGARSTAGRAMIRVLRELLDPHSAAALATMTRVVGGEPPAQPTCGHCLLCLNTMPKVRQATTEAAVLRNSAD